VISGVEVPGRQGVKPLEYRDIPRFCFGIRTGASPAEMANYF
jgi:hypothetical protein